MPLDVLSTGGGVYIGGTSSEEGLELGEGVEVKVTPLDVLRIGGGV